MFCRFESPDLGAAQLLGTTGAGLARHALDVVRQTVKHRPVWLTTRAALPALHSVADADGIARASTADVTSHEPSLFTRQHEFFSACEVGPLEARPVVYRLARPRWLASLGSRTLCGRGQAVVDSTGRTARSRRDDRAGSRA